MTPKYTIGPSGAGLLSKCSGSLIAQSRYPNGETEATRNGTAVHWVIEKVLTAYQTPGANGGLLPSGYVGQKAPNGVTITDIMAEGADIMVDDVLSVVSSRGGMSRLQIEQSLPCPSIHPLCGGTPDLWIYYENTKTLIIWDYKNGHCHVDAHGNSQMIEYVSGIVDQLQLIDTETTVVFRVIQPFCYYKPGGPRREWVVKASELRAEVNHLHNMSHEALTDPHLSAGLHCRDCAAVHDCPAARGLCYELIDWVKRRPFATDDMTSADMAVERQIMEDGLAVLKARKEGLDDTLRHAVESGDASAGLTLESVPGALEWTCEPAVAAGVAEQFGVKIWREPTVKTPRQAVSTIAKDQRLIFEQAIKSITKRKHGAVALVPIDESRTARAFKPKKQEG